MKQLVIHPERCTACRMCELACSMEHEGVFDPSRSRIQVEIFLDEAFYLPMACYHCDDYPCGQVCPTEAIVKDRETGWITVIDEKCIGCKMCMQACPFGVMGYATTVGVAQNCDLCEGDPECVKFCAPQALEFLNIEATKVHKRGLFAEKVRQAMTGEGVAS
ncbi:MAG: 4Fe-4S dicluster domain-containing protein [Nitrospinota bacterium]|nr:MAG: 4Fe-4S dicluster domain-containing protein [Nitrospinota bacterium]